MKPRKKPASEQPSSTHVEEDNKEKEEAKDNGDVEERKADSLLVDEAKSIVGGYFRTILFFSYFGSGLLFFMLGPEKWTAIQTIYYLIVTLTTVGYGDVSPTTSTSQIVGVFFIFFGIIVIFPILAEAAMKFVEFTDDLAKDWMSVQQTTIKVKLLLAGLYIFISMFVGSLFFGILEARNGKWSAMDPIWWTVCTVTTVGYGDLSFQNTLEARVFLIFFIPFSVILVGAAINSMSNAYGDYKQELKERRLLSTFNMNLIRKFDTNGNGVDQSEYVLGMLILMELVDEDKVAIYSAQFDEYDKDKSGTLDSKDLDAIEQEYKSGKVKLERKASDAHSEQI